MSAKKVSLAVFPGYYVPHIGGLETHVDELVRHLARDPTFEITVFAPRLPPSAPAEEIRHQRVRVLRYPAREIISNYPVPQVHHPEFWKLYLRLFRAPPDVVMTRTRFFSNAFLGFLLAKARGCKLVHVEHGSAFIKLESRLKTALARAYDLTLGRLVVRKADQVVAISQAVREFLKTHFLPEAEIPVIYRGLDFEVLDSVAPDPEVLRILNRRVGISFVGRLLKWKGVENLLLAYAGLPEELRAQSLLLVVGDGEDCRRLESLAQDLGIKPWFLGAVSRTRALSILKASEVYVHPSYAGGGLSSSLLEAMYLHCAVVASPHEGAQEVVIPEKTGLLLPDNQPENIRAALVQLLKEPEKRRLLAQGARDFVARHFSWEESVRRYREILLSLVQ